MEPFSQTSRFLPSARLLYKALPPAPELLSQASRALLSAFWDAYEKNGNDLFLSIAAAHMQAYHELYASPAGPEEALPNIRPTANRLSSVLGRWPASPHASHTKPEAIQDILSRLEAHRCGLSVYQNGSRNQALHRILTLTIDEQKALLCDWQNMKIYSLTMNAKKT